MMDTKSECRVAVITRQGFRWDSVHATREKAYELSLILKRAMLSKEDLDLFVMDDKRVVVGDLGMAQIEVPIFQVRPSEIASVAVFDEFVTPIHQDEEDEDEGGIDFMGGTGGG